MKKNKKNIKYKQILNNKKYMKKKINFKATSIIEAMIVILIVVTWTTWVYNVLSKSQDLTTSTKNKIQAIEIARQWIEIFTNIRDTNWKIFPSDYEGCWNVLNYNSSCLWDTTTTYDIENWKSYRVFRNTNNRWFLENGNIIPNNYSNNDYRNFYKVWLDNNWIYSQKDIVEELKPIYTRELIIKYLKENLTNWDESSPKIEIRSLVQWSDSSSSIVRKVEIKQILTNWRKF